MGQTNGKSDFTRLLGEIWHHLNHHNVRWSIWMGSEQVIQPFIDFLVQLLIEGRRVSMVGSNFFGCEEVDFRYWKIGWINIFSILIKICRILRAIHQFYRCRIIHYWPLRISSSLRITCCFICNSHSKNNRSMLSVYRLNIAYWFLLEELYKRMIFNCVIDSFYSWRNAFCYKFHLELILEIVFRQLIIMRWDGIGNGILFFVINFSIIQILFNV